MSTVRAINCEAIHWGRNVGSLNFKLTPHNRTRIFTNEAAITEGFDEAILLTKKQRASKKWDLSFYATTSNPTARECKVYNGAIFEDIRPARLPKMSTANSYY